MKKLGILMAAAMLFAGTAVFAGTPAKVVKQTTQKEAPAKKAHKAHKKHHTAAKKTKTAAAPKAK